MIDKVMSSSSNAEAGSGLFLGDGATEDVGGVKGNLCADGEVRISRNLW